MVSQSGHIQQHFSRKHLRERVLLSWQQVGVTKEKRIQYARELLEKNFLPHISISPGCQTAKVPACAAERVGYRASLQTMQFLFCYTTN